MENKSTDLLIEKWSPVLDAEEAGPIKNYYRKAVTAQVLENQERETEKLALFETPAANSVAGGGIANWNPILISLVRRAMPNLMAFDVAGVQAMTGPTGLIFAMKSKYTSQGGTEALGLNEPVSSFSGSQQAADTPQAGPSSSLGGTDTTPADTVNDAFKYGIGMTTAFGEDLGDAGAGTFNEMAIAIESATVTARTRALMAEYTMELAQDLKAIHNLEAEGELSNMLSTEILAEINREMIRTINVKAKLGAQTSNVATAGIFNLSTDSDGRWSVEKFKGLLVQIDREANIVAKETRRGKGNFIICSSDVATALHASGLLDYAPALKTDLEVDDTGNTFAGTINGRIKVYIDPYSTDNYVTVGYRGSNQYDAGIFYCPYVPLTMVRAVDPLTFQPKIGFKTRYGMVANPFAQSTPQSGTGANRSNPYFRIFAVADILTS
jgi:hypothetical protein